MGPQIKKLGSKNLGCSTTSRSLSFLLAQGGTNKVQGKAIWGIYMSDHSGSLVSDHSKRAFKAGSLFF